MTHDEPTTLYNAGSRAPIQLRFPGKQRFRSGTGILIVAPLAGAVTILLLLWVLRALGASHV